MNTKVYDELLTELKEGRKAAVLTVMEKQDSRDKLSHNKVFLNDNVHSNNNVILHNNVLSNDNMLLNNNVLLNNKVPINNKVLFTEASLITSDSQTNLDEDTYQNIREAITTGNIQFHETQERRPYLIEPYFPEPRLIILGGGHIAKPLTEFGAKVGFSVTVMDDRPSFANKARFPEAEHVICESFEKSFDMLNLNNSAFVVIVTRGHRYDMECLRQVLGYDTAYVGMIGSRRRVKSVKEQLLSECYSDEQLNKVNAPIGLDIGAITPEEIAIAIIAQVISYRRKAITLIGTSEIVKINWSEFDRAVLMELCKEKEDPKAIITVFATKGSVPRKAGAKMLVWADGRTLGSIGGGCSEGAVIRTALEVIKNGRYQVKKIDMTGSYAEEEGMVCGGTMEVLIEAYN